MSQENLLFRINLKAVSDAVTSTAKILFIIRQKNLLLTKLLALLMKKKILKNNLSYYIDKLHYLYKLVIKILNNKKFFRYHRKLKKIIYEESIFLTDTDDNLLSFIVNTLMDDEHENPFIEVVEDSDYLLNLLVKLTIKFFNKKKHAPKQ